MLNIDIGVISLLSVEKLCLVLLFLCALVGYGSAANTPDNWHINYTILSDTQCTAPCSVTVQDTTTDIYDVFQYWNIWKYGYDINCDGTREIETTSGGYNNITSWVYNTSGNYTICHSIMTLMGWTDQRNNNATVPQYISVSSIVTPVNINTWTRNKANDISAIILVGIIIAVVAVIVLIVAAVVKKE